MDVETSADLNGGAGAGLTVLFWEGWIELEWNRVFFPDVFLSSPSGNL